MGLILRQGSWNTVLSYIGAAVGVLNLIFLYPFYFQPDQIGLIRLLTSLSLLFAHVASLGNGSIFIRFFPHFKSADKRHEGFVGAIWSYAALGFVLATLGYMILRPLLLDIYADSASLFVTYDLVLVPLALFVVVFNLAEIMDRSVFQTVFTLFVREVLLRLLTTVGIVGVAFGGWGFELFLAYYLGIHALTALIVLVRTVRSGEFKWTLDSGFFDARRRRIMLRYGGITFFTGITTFIVQSIDSLMLGAYVSLDAVGVYTIAFFMGSVIAMPARAISRIATPIVADAWKRNDLTRIDAVYRSSCWLNFLAGGVVLSLILLNLHDLYEILPPIYATGFMVVVLIGFGHWMDMTGGLNTNILATSPKYHLDLYVNAAFIAACILFNLWLIPPYGLTGAALASLMSYVMVNLIRSLILYRRYGFQPFGARYLTGLVVMLIAAGVTWFVPVGDLSVFVSIPIRSGVFIALIAAFGYLTRLHTHIQTEIRL